MTIEGELKGDAKVALDQRGGKTGVPNQPERRGFAEEARERSRERERGKEVVSHDAAGPGRRLACLIPAEASGARLRIPAARDARQPVRPQEVQLQVTADRSRVWRGAEETVERTGSWANGDRAPARADEHEALELLGRMGVTAHTRQARSEGGRGERS